MEINAYAEQLATQALAASYKTPTLTGAKRDEALMAIADLLEARAGQIVQANGLDMQRSDDFGVSDAFKGKLKLDEAGVIKMASAVREIAAQVDPVGEVLEGYTRPNGLRLEKRRAPLGVVMVIYESRPNVTSDAAALCLKSGNAVILRGGKEAIHSNMAIAAVIRDALDTVGLDPNIVQVVDNPDRALLSMLLKKDDAISLVIPRGGEGLIRAVVEQSTIPVIKHYTGNCHVYVDRHASGLPAGQVREIVVNAKTQRPGVCNAAESVLFHENAEDLMVETCRALAAAGVEMRVCDKSAKVLEGHVAESQMVKAEETDWSAEYLDMVIAVKVVAGLGEAVEHINRYGSKHTDAILTSDCYTADLFAMMVDSADVMINCSTRWSDGGEYGLGAEIGISTDKLHARGPMGAKDLTTYKWVVRGNGHIRE